MQFRFGHQRTWPDVPGFDDVGRSQGCRQPLEARKAKDTDSPLGPPERNAVLQTPEFSQRDLLNCGTIR